MRVILDGSVCFDPFGACFNYHQQIAPRLVEKGFRVTITPTPTGALDELRHLGPDVLSPLLPRGKWLPHGPLRNTLSKLKQKVERWRWSPRLRGKMEPAVFQSYYYGLPVNDSVAYVPMIMDMIQEKFPNWFSDSAAIKKLKADCVKRADRIIAISECTRQDMLEYYEVDPEKIEVVYLSIDPAFYDPIPENDLRDFKLEWRLPETFLLQVGGRACHKNFDRFLDAFSIYSRKENIHLVSAGAAWTPDETDKIEALGLKDRVHLIHKPKVETLVRLYRCARGLVYPSIYEGFGLPPVEAMASGVPVAASTGGAIPEITGGAAALFDPLSVTAMVQAIERIRDPKESQRLKELGAKRCLEFSWDKIAEQTAKVHERALRGMSPKSDR